MNWKWDEFAKQLYPIMDRNNSGVPLPKMEATFSGNAFCVGHFDLFSISFPEAVFSDDPRRKYDVVMVWGHTPKPRLLRIAERDKCPICLCEEGVIRSVDTWCNRACPARERTSVSLVVDTGGYFYDSMRKSQLMTWLDDPAMEITEQEKEEANAFIKRIVSEKVSKYNHQPFSLPPIKEIGREGHDKVLVIDQSYGDFSIKRGGANDETFSSMLEDAARDNPDCDILVKTHPDVIAPGTKRTGYYQGLAQHDNIFPITFPCNPYSLMEIVSKVYVCSSTFGLEALMAGKDVYVYGKPWYAGWGLTHDKQDVMSTRHRKRTLEELIHYLYFKYIIWNDPDKRTRCSPDSALEWIIENRNARFRLEGRMPT